MLNLGIDFMPATAGDIATINLDSARHQFWSRFCQAPQRPGIAEYIVEQEHLTVQFLGDLNGLDRIKMLVKQLEFVDPGSARTNLIGTQVASMTHCFADARRHLAHAQRSGALVATVDRLSLGIDQACGRCLDAVLAIRRRIAGETRQLEDLVPLGALLADLGQFDEADKTYRKALRSYQDVSPFAPAWVCFQLGVLWGELVPERRLAHAAQWYRRALEYLPSYVKARVHLAEICLDGGQPDEAEAILIPVITSNDPEVRWRLSDVSAALGRDADAAMHMEAARLGFETLLDKHLLAFADHGAMFYANSGNNPTRALELASINAANRPTPRAILQVRAIAISQGKPISLTVSGAP